MVSDFDEFVRVRSARLLRTAYLLTQDHALAEDLLQTALARSWSVWPRMDGDPEPYVRKVLVNTYNSWWRRRWNAERPAVELPESEMSAPQSNVDDRDEVWRALQRLPRQQRAVLVLRYFEDLSEAQIAEAMSISTGSVKHYASKGLAKLRLDPSLLSVPVEAPPGTERVAAIHERIRNRRRTRFAATAAVVVVLVGLASFLFAQQRRAEPIRPSPSPSEYFQGKQVVGSLLWTDIGTRSASFTWVPTSLRSLYFYGDCQVSDHEDDFGIALVIDGKAHGATGCSRFRPERNDDLQRAGAFVLRTKDLVAAGIQPNVPVTVTVKITRIRGSEPEPPSGRFGALLAQSVPFAEYPLPSPPAILPSLPARPAPSDALARITADGPWSAQIPWQGRFRAYGYAQAPGEIRFRVNGVLAEGPDLGFWSYSTMSYHSSGQTYEWPGDVPQPVLGAPVTVEVEITGLTSGYWYVDILEVTDPAIVTRE